MQPIQPNPDIVQQLTTIANTVNWRQELSEVNETVTFSKPRIGLTIVCAVAAAACEYSSIPQIVLSSFTLIALFTTRVKVSSPNLNYGDQLARINTHFAGVVMQLNEAHQYASHHILDAFRCCPPCDNLDDASAQLASLKIAYFEPGPNDECFSRLPEKEWRKFCVALYPSARSIAITDWTYHKTLPNNHISKLLLDVHDACTRFVFGNLREDLNYIFLSQGKTSIIASPWPPTE